MIPRNGYPQNTLFIHTSNKPKFLIKPRKFVGKFSQPQRAFNVVVVAIVIVVVINTITIIVVVVAAATDVVAVSVPVAVM